MLNRRIGQRVSTCTAVALSSVLIAGCEGTASPAAPSPPPAAGSSTRTPPIIVSLSTSETGTVEVNRDVTVRAEITETDTTVDRLSFIWSSNAGTITGTGPTVTWRLPRSAVRTPIDVTIALTVVEAFTVPAAGGGSEAREFRVTREAAPLRAHDSLTEISEIALGYLTTRYGDSRLTPSQCLANFSDRCTGKADELAEITAHRSKFENLTAEAWLGPVNVDRARGTAEIEAPCRFTSRELATGQIATTTGDCRLTAIYDQQRWWLCSSTLLNARTSPARRD